MRLLLDTHVFLWLINDDYAHLRGKSAAQLFLDEHNSLFFSLASIWELAIKASLGKINLARPVNDFIPEQLALNGVQLLEISLEHVLKNHDASLPSSRSVRPLAHCPSHA